MTLVPPLDLGFLLAESREHPMHVGGLQLFEPPEGEVIDLSRIHAELLADVEVAPTFRRRVRRSAGSLWQAEWVEDDQLDLAYHVRHSALPKPGSIRNLLELTSRLHGTLLDRNRPLWECHLIEGLEDGRYAVYTKVHHAMFDGVSALRLLGRSLSSDPDARGVPAPWSAHSDAANGRPPSRSGSFDPGALLRGAVRTASDLAGVPAAVLRNVADGLREETHALPFRAPSTRLNQPITGARRFAAQSWDLDRLRTVATRTGTTLNDVLLAMCSGALRTYLLGLEDLPDAPLIAMVPVSLRSESELDDGGNSVGVILCNLGTHHTDPVARLECVAESMAEGKSGLRGLTPLQVVALSAGSMVPLVVSAALPLPEWAPPPFNVTISNVPGPTEPLYWNGSRLDGVYPASIPLDGQALNITVTSYAGRLEFGITGCRRQAPRLQRLLGHLEVALAELESETA